MRLSRRGQSLLEYTVLIIVILGVFIAMKTYIRRGFEGRWRDAVDQYGEQYDPRLVNSSVTHTLNTTSNTVIQTLPSQGGYYTNRVDLSHTEERRDGFISVGDQSQINGFYINGLPQ